MPLAGWPLGGCWRLERAGAGSTVARGPRLTAEGVELEQDSSHTVLLTRRATLRKVSGAPGAGAEGPERVGGPGPAQGRVAPRLRVSGARETSNRFEPLG